MQKCCFSFVETLNVLIAVSYWKCLKGVEMFELCSLLLAHFVSFTIHLPTLGSTVQSIFLHSSVVGNSTWNWNKQNSDNTVNWKALTYWPKILNFSYPALIQCRRLRWALSSFWMNFLSRKLNPWDIHRWRFRDPSLRHFDSVPACDRQTDIPTAANSKLCWRPVQFLKIRS